MTVRRILSLLSVLCFTEWAPQCLATTCASTSGTSCIGSSNYCPGSYYTGSTCVDGYCRCANNPNRDYCTCLAISGDCRIEQGSSSAVGTPTYRGGSQTSYSCVADENCDYDVHIISNYEGNYNHGFGPVTRSGTTYVNIQVTGESSKPLVLVFVSYEPVNWIMSTNRVIDKVLLGSFYLDNSKVTYSSGSILDVERHTRQTLPSGYGSDTGGGNTDKILSYVVGRFGYVSSFSGSYRADRWSLNIHQSNTTVCRNVTVPTSSSIPFTPSQPSISSGPYTSNQPFTPSRPSFPPRLSTPSTSSSRSAGVAITIATPVSAFLLCCCVMICIFVCCRACKENNAHSYQRNVNMVGGRRFVEPVAPGATGQPRAVLTQQHQSPFQFRYEQRTNIFSISSSSAREPQGVLIDSAPPAYDTAIHLPPPQPVTAHLDGHTEFCSVKPSLDNPPPYPGSEYV